jgi:hypothetical protein
MQFARLRAVRLIDEDEDVSLRAEVLGAPTGELLEEVGISLSLVGVAV